MYKITHPTRGLKGQRMVWIYRTKKRHQGASDQVFRGTGPTNEEAMRNAIRAVREWRRAGCK